MNGDRKCTYNNWKNKTCDCSSRLKSYSYAVLKQPVFTTNTFYNHIY